jgi:hypothetical protein
LGKSSRGTKKSGVSSTELTEVHREEVVGKEIFGANEETDGVTGVTEMF